MALVFYVYIIFGYAIYGIISFFLKKSDEAERIELKKKIDEKILQENKFVDSVGDPGGKLEEEIKKELTSDPAKFEKLKEEAKNIIRDNSSYAVNLLEYLEKHGDYLDRWLDLVAQFEGIKRGKILGLDSLCSPTALSNLKYIPRTDPRVFYRYIDDIDPTADIGLLKWAEGVLQANGVDTYHVYDGKPTQADPYYKIKLHQFAYYKDRRI